MKKLSISLFVVTMVVMFLWFYEKRRIAKILSPQFVYWVEAVESARDLELSSGQFLEKYGSRADIVSQEESMIHLREMIEVESLLCNYAILDIHYSFGTDGSASFYGVRGNDCD